MQIKSSILPNTVEWPFYYIHISDFQNHLDSRTKKNNEMTHAYSEVSDQPGHLTGPDPEPAQLVGLWATGGGGRPGAGSWGLHQYVIIPGAKWRGWRPSALLLDPGLSPPSLISLRCPHQETWDPKLPTERTAKTLIRLGGCPADLSLRWMHR